MRRKQKRNSRPSLNAALSDDDDDYPETNSPIEWNSSGPQQQISTNFPVQIQRKISQSARYRRKKSIGGNRNPFNALADDVDASAETISAVSTADEDEDGDDVIGNWEDAADSNSSPSSNADVEQPLGFAVLKEAIVQDLVANPLATMIQISYDIGPGDSVDTIAAEGLDREESTYLDAVEGEDSEAVTGSDEKMMQADDVGETAQPVAESNAKTAEVDTADSIVIPAGTTAFSFGAAKPVTRFSGYNSSITPPPPLQFNFGRVPGASPTTTSFSFADLSSPRTAKPGNVASAVKFFDFGNPASSVPAEGSPATASRAFPSTSGFGASRFTFAAPSAKALPVLDRPSHDFDFELKGPNETCVVSIVSPDGQEYHPKPELHQDSETSEDEHELHSTPWDDFRQSLGAELAEASKSHEAMEESPFRPSHEIPRNAEDATQVELAELPSTMDKELVGDGNAVSLESDEESENTEADELTNVICEETALLDPLASPVVQDLLATFNTAGDESDEGETSKDAVDIALESNPVSEGKSEQSSAAEIDDSLEEPSKLEAASQGVSAEAANIGVATDEWDDMETPKASNRENPFEERKKYEVVSSPMHPDATEARQLSGADVESPAILPADLEETFQSELTEEPREAPALNASELPVVEHPAALDSKKALPDEVLNLDEDGLDVAVKVSDTEKAVEVVEAAADLEDMTTPVVPSMDNEIFPEAVESALEKEVARAVSNGDDSPPEIVVPVPEDSPADFGKEHHSIANVAGSDRASSASGGSQTEAEVSAFDGTEVRSGTTSSVSAAGGFGEGKDSSLPLNLLARSSIEDEIIAQFKAKTKAQVKSEHYAEVHANPGILKAIEVQARAEAIAEIVEEELQRLETSDPCIAEDISDPETQSVRTEAMDLSSSTLSPEVETINSSTSSAEMPLDGHGTTEENATIMKASPIADDDTHLEDSMKATPTGNDDTRLEDGLKASPKADADILLEDGGVVSDPALILAKTAETPGSVADTESAEPIVIATISDHGNSSSVPMSQDLQLAIELGNGISEDGDSSSVPVSDDQKPAFELGSEPSEDGDSSSVSVSDDQQPGIQLESGQQDEIEEKSKDLRPDLLSRTDSLGSLDEQYLDPEPESSADAIGSPAEDTEKDVKHSIDAVEAISTYDPPSPILNKPFPDTPSSEVSSPSDSGASESQAESETYESQYEGSDTDDDGKDAREAQATSPSVSRRRSSPQLHIDTKHLSTASDPPSSSLKRGVYAVSHYLDEILHPPNRSPSTVGQLIHYFSGGGDDGSGSGSEDERDDDSPVGVRSPTEIDEDEDIRFKRVAEHAESGDADDDVAESDDEERDEISDHADNEADDQETEDDDDEGEEVGAQNVTVVRRQSRLRSTAARVVAGLPFRRQGGARPMSEGLPLEEDQDDSPRKQSSSIMKRMAAGFGFRKGQKSDTTADDSEDDSEDASPSESGEENGAEQETNDDRPSLFHKVAEILPFHSTSSSVEAEQKKYRKEATGESPRSQEGHDAAIALAAVESPNILAKVVDQLASQNGTKNRDLTGKEQPLASEEALPVLPKSHAERGTDVATSWPHRMFFSHFHRRSGSKVNQEIQPTKQDPVSVSTNGAEAKPMSRTAESSVKNGTDSQSAEPSGADVNDVEDKPSSLEKVKDSLPLQATATPAEGNVASQEPDQVEDTAAAIGTAGLLERVFKHIPGHDTKADSPVAAQSRGVNPQVTSSNNVETDNQAVEDTAPASKIRSVMAKVLPFVHSPDKTEEPAEKTEAVETPSLMERMRDHLPFQHSSEDTTRDVPAQGPSSKIQNLKETIQSHLPSVNDGQSHSETKREHGRDAVEEAIGVAGVLGGAAALVHDAASAINPFHQSGLQKLNPLHQSPLEKAIPQESLLDKVNPLHESPLGKVMPHESMLNKLNPLHKSTVDKLDPRESTFQKLNPFHQSLTEKLDPRESTLEKLNPLHKSLVEKMDPRESTLQKLNPFHESLIDKLNPLHQESSLLEKLDPRQHHKSLMGHVVSGATHLAENVGEFPFKHPMEAAALLAETVHHKDKDAEEERGAQGQPEAKESQSMLSAAVDKVNPFHKDHENKDSARENEASARSDAEEEKGAESQAEAKESQSMLSAAFDKVNPFHKDDEAEASAQDSQALPDSNPVEDRTEATQDSPVSDEPERSVTVANPVVEEPPSILGSTMLGAAVATVVDAMSTSHKDQSDEGIAERDGQGEQVAVVAPGEVLPPNAIPSTVTLSTGSESTPQPEPQPAEDEQDRGPSASPPPMLGSSSLGKIVDSVQTVVGLPFQRRTTPRTPAPNSAEAAENDAPVTSSRSRIRRSDANCVCLPHLRAHHALLAADMQHMADDMNARISAAATRLGNASHRANVPWTETPPAMASELELIGAEVQCLFRRRQMLAEKQRERWDYIKARGKDLEARGFGGTSGCSVDPRRVGIGVVVASPSRSNPDYFYHWTRDAALVMRTVVRLYSLAGDVPEKSVYEDRLWEYAAFSKSLEVPARAAGFGDPKYMVDGSDFTQPWGRPQHDGPALRAVSLIEFAEAFLEAGGDKEIVERNLIGDSTWGVHADLLHVVRTAGATGDEADGFDLWEEIKGYHYYTRVVQLEAVRKGAAFLASFPDVANQELRRDLSLAGTRLENVIPTHWSAEGNYIMQTLDRTGGIDYKTSNLDTATLLACLHAPDSVDITHVHATLAKLIESMRGLYPINGRNLPPALGRYPEDLYDGYGTSRGNPWFLTTLAAAELLYRYDPKRTHPKLTALLTVESGRHSERELRESANRLADGFLRRVRSHAPGDGRLSEQMDRDTGFIRGARDLTWSYAALLTAGWARDAREHKSEDAQVLRVQA
ncbi:Glucoamylase, intracellular sporulation-specific [Thoreauomyces humboldtii]|nr:Glucoamylase, intracellular sporulation-specific [Thoreauomyces humboldtii]